MFCVFFSNMSWNGLLYADKLTQFIDIKVIYVFCCNSFGSDLRVFGVRFFKLVVVQNCTWDKRSRNSGPIFQEVCVSWEMVKHRSCWKRTSGDGWVLLLWILSWPTWNLELPVKYRSPIPPSPPSPDNGCEHIWCCCSSILWRNDLASFSSKSCST